MYTDYRTASLNSLPAPGVRVGYKKMTVLV